MKAKLVTILLMMSMMMATTAYAAGPSEGAQTTQSQQQQATQSDRWEGAGDTWKVRTQDNTGYLTNSWFQDNDASWYMLGADGTMSSGIIFDESTGKSYLLNTEHDGTYGKMLTQDGAHNVNGVTVYLTFDQNHNGTYGAITSGLSEARSTGVKVTQLPSIPTDSASSSPTQQSQNTNEQQSNTAQQTPAKSTGGSILDDIRESEQKVGTPTYNGSGENWLQG